MSVYALLNILDVLRKIHKMRDLLIILSLFPNEFNKVNNTGVCILDSINHLTLKLH